MNRVKSTLSAIPRLQPPISSHFSSFHSTSFPSSSSSSSSEPKPPSSSANDPSNDHLTSEERSRKKLEHLTSKPPPYLSRAPGITSPPRKEALSKEEWRANFLSPERRIDERRHLVKQVAKGYFHDYNELRHSGGKTWVAPKTLIREDVSTVFEATTLMTTSAYDSVGSARKLLS